MIRGGMDSERYRLFFDSYLEDACGGMVLGAVFV
jgi:hypothetical protein